MTPSRPLKPVDSPKPPRRGMPMTKRRGKSPEPSGATNVTQLRPAGDEEDSYSSGRRRFARPQLRASGLRSHKQRPHVPYAFGCGVLAALIVAFLVECVVAVGWLSDPKSTASWNDALGVGIAIWSLAQRAHVTSNGATVVFAPLLLSLLSVVVVAAMARMAMPKQRLRVEDLRLVFLAFIGGYVVAAQLLGRLAALGSVSVSWWSLILGPALVAALGLAATLWRHRDRSPELASWDRSMNRAAPLLFRRSLRSAFRGMALFGVLSFVEIIILMAWHGERMWTVQQQLHPGIAGGALLIAGQILALPNSMAYAASWSSGSAIGFGAVSIGHGGMTTGLLPMIPVLGALPNGGVQPWSWGALLVPIDRKSVV